MLFKFKEWLFNESQTVIQFLKQKGNIEPIKQVVSSFVQKLNIPVNAAPYLINWLTKEIIVSETPHYEQYLNNVWQQVGNYITHNISNNQFLSKLNTVDLTYDKMIEASQQWFAKGKPASIGRTIIDLGNGWKWVSLDKRYCQQEGDAMGHCGNSTGHAGDNILSLRDPRNVPKLTFIVNNRALGESKGIGNSKPSAKYHPAIIALLKSDYVQTIKGGSFVSGNDFKFEDLPSHVQQELLKVKPYLNDPKKYSQQKFLEKNSAIINNIKSKLANGEIDENIKQEINEIGKELGHYSLIGGVSEDGYLIKVDWIKIEPRIKQAFKELIASSSSDKIKKLVKSTNTSASGRSFDTDEDDSHGSLVDLLNNEYIKLLQENRLEFKFKQFIEKRFSVQFLYSPNTLAEFIGDGKFITGGVNDDIEKIVHYCPTVFNNLIDKIYEKEASRRKPVGMPAPYIPLPD